MNDAYPMPYPSPDTMPYWLGLREGRLLVQKCGGCGTLRHYPRPVCATCFSMEVDWTEMSGRGAVHSWTETHHAFLPAFKEDVPYILVTVDLDEGVRINARFRGKLSDVKIGLPIRCCFERAGEWVLPAFAAVS
jgi:uncharacterized OB-fold protein